MLIICIKTNVVSRQIEYIVHLVSLIIVAGIVTEFTFVAVTRPKIIPGNLSHRVAK